MRKVLKFGGTSVGSIDRIKKVAHLILDYHSNGNQIIVVVSAMGGETDRLESLIQQISSKDSREKDLILSSGEQVSVGLLTMSLNQISKRRIAKSYMAYDLPLGSQSQQHGNESLDYLNQEVLERDLAKGQIVVLPGFQAYNGKHLVTLGRGGSDTSAVSIAGQMKADLCQIHTDVDGIYSCDPRYYSDAYKYKEMTNKQMLELSKNGAKVMHDKSILEAQKWGIDIEVKSTFTPHIPGTFIRAQKISTGQGPTIYGMTFKKDFSLFKSHELKPDTIQEEKVTWLESSPKGFQIAVEKKHAPIVKQSIQQQGLKNDLTMSSGFFKVSILGNGKGELLEEIESRYLKEKAEDTWGTHLQEKSLELFVKPQEIQDTSQWVHTRYKHFFAGGDQWK